MSLITQVHVGQVFQLSANLVLSNDTNAEDLALPLTWTLSDYTHANFKDGNADRSRIKLIGLSPSPGPITITVTDGTLTGTMLVQVIPAVTPTNLALQIQETPVEQLPYGTPPYGMESTGR